MSEYAKVISFIFDLAGNEFMTQILLVALLFIPVCKRRSLFFVRYPLCLAVMVLYHWLCRLCNWNILPPLSYFFTVVMLFCTNLICFRTDVWQALFLSVCVYCVQHLISNISYSLIYVIVFSAKRWEPFEYYFIIMPIVTAAGMAAAYFFMVRWLCFTEELKFNSNVVIYIITAFILVASVLTYYGRQSIFYMLDGVTYMLIIASLFTVSTLVMGFMNIRKQQLEQENTILIELMHKDKQRYEQAKLSNEKIQIKYHDIKQREHQGIVDYEELSEIEGDKEILNSTYFTGNPALDVVLSEKALLCGRLGIRFICTADGSVIEFMKPYHIYSLIGNALQNCIESVREQDDDVQKEIIVEIVRRNNMCVIKTTNYSCDALVLKDGIPQTKKTDIENHGFGTKSMRNVVHKYGGQISFISENNIFTMLAAIPLLR